ncbi:MAG: hypothetical protein Q9220_005586 [cf. Caloplaca sp. 1 TL-2023]
MPHTGKPSGACQTCKSRHVKCDETRPACLRCVKIKRTCPGYTEGLDLVLRDQNQVAKANTERRLKVSPKRRTENPASSNDSASPQNLNIESPMVESQDFYAHGFFVSAYVLGQRDPRTDHGFLELLPSFFGKMKSNSVLSSSLAVVSHCYFGAWEPAIRNIETIVVQRNYAKSLNTLQLALRSRQDCLTDEVLMAVCLLNFFESTVRTIMSRPRSDQHVNGALALVKQRRSSTMTSDVSKRLLIAVRHEIVSAALANSTFVDESPEVWDDPDDMPYNPATLLDFICLEAANTLAAAAELISSTQTDNKSDDDAALSSILGRANAGDARFSSWPSHIPQEWTPVSLPRKLIPQEIIDAGVHGDHCDIYSYTSVCNTWNSWRAAYIKTLVLLADYDQTTAKRGIVLHIQQLADDVLASIPFLLGSKVKPADMYDMDIVYPCLPGKTVSASHYQSAAAFGGSTLWAPMRAILDFMHYMREDQIQFTMRQFRRLGTLYDARMTKQDT